MAQSRSQKNSAGNKHTAKKSAVPGITFVRELDGIFEYRLNKNGLQILLIPDAAQPIAGCMVTYHVGSRNEATGYTGATHLLEHLMFKGTEKFNRKKGTSIVYLLEQKGAELNATTWLDRTNYYEIVPRELLPLALEIEADRMRNAQILEEHRQKEMTVVRNEFEQDENNPYSRLGTAVWAAAFQAHPYHHPTIGWRSDIENVPIERLQWFYDQYYWPDNATLSVAGGFDTENVLAMIKQHFGIHPRNPNTLVDLYTKEPPQEGQRRVTVEGTGYDIFSLSYRMPDAQHPDIPALAMLGMVLADGKTSRLYKSLVDDQSVSTSVHVSYQQFKDPGLFEISLPLAKGVSHQKAEESLHTELELVMTKGVTKRELDKAKKSMRTSLAYQRDGLYSLLSALNEKIATGDWTLFATQSEKFQAVSEKDIRRVARTYFKEDQSIVGQYVNKT